MSTNDAPDGAKMTAGFIVGAGLGLAFVAGRALVQALIVLAAKALP